MITTVFPVSTLQPGSEIDSEMTDLASAVLALISTDLEWSFPCKPITPLSSVITWKPVILPLLERLSELRSLPVTQRWPGAEWPNKVAFQDAARFTELLPVPLKAQPHISLADDGEINFAWSHKGTRIDLGFYGTNTFSYYAREENGKEWFGDDKPVASPLPVELEKLLTA